MENLKQELLNQGANLVGFAVVEGLYHKCDLSGESTVDSEKEEFKLPEYPRAISIAVAIPKDIIRGISSSPTMDYLRH